MPGKCNPEFRRPRGVQDISDKHHPLPCHDGADHTRVKHPIVNKDEPRMHTNKHEYPWTSFAATPSREEAPSRERGRLARTTLA